MASYAAPKADATLAFSELALFSFSLGYGSVETKESSVPSPPAGVGALPRASLLHSMATSVTAARGIAVALT